LRHKLASLAHGVIMTTKLWNKGLLQIGSAKVHAGAHAFTLVRLARLWLLHIRLISVASRPTSNRVDFIDEYDRGRDCSGLLERLPHGSLALADIHTVQLCP
jgi:hypothetical protein